MVSKQRKIIRSSFLVQIKHTGYFGVYQRTGNFGRRGNPKLEKIKELYGPSIPEMLGNDSIVEKLENGANERFQKNLDHEINRISK